jgi:hypothetical protein
MRLNFTFNATRKHQEARYGTSHVRYLVPPFADFTRCCAIRCACTCARIARLPRSSSGTPSTSTYGDKSTPSRSTKAISGFAAIDSANARPSLCMSVPIRLYVLRCENKAAHVCSSRCVIPYILLCIRGCRHAKYKHACMPCTYIYLHSTAQRNSIYHVQTCPTTTHSCEQAMYCTHSSVWSVELCASAAAMCCAPSTPM